MPKVNNALKHGITAKTLILQNEDPALFQEILLGFQDEWRPVTQTQTALVTDLAIARWYLLRVDRYLTGMLDREMDAQSEDFEKRYITHDEGIRGADAFTALADRGQSLNTVHRFRVQFLRAFHRTINELTKLQNKTLPPEIPPPIASPCSSVSIGGQTPASIMVNDAVRPTDSGVALGLDEPGGDAHKPAEAVKPLALALALVSGVRFENVAPQSGFTQSIPNGGDTEKQFILETTGSGVAFIDYDNDGLLDAFVASGPGSPSRLYHNKGGGKFQDVTEAMGLTQTGWAQGVCAGDYDNDGFTDLFVTYWGANHLYRNLQGRRFEDVTAQAHLSQDRTRYNTGCAFLDYDNDGHLDLFVANYLKFDPKTTPKPGDNPYCFYRGMAVSCGPRGLPFDRNILYHNDGRGVFTDVSEASGIAQPHQNYSLGVLTGDFNHDGLIDIYVACDQTPSLLYINQGNGKFEEEGLLRGVAFDSNGKALSGMGVTAADYDLSGALAIFRTNFSDERETLYRSQNKRGEFEDVTIAAGLSRNTRFVGWGCGFFDFDNDGFKDLLIVNGHVFPEVEKLKLDIHYKDRAILYRNLGNGKFEDVSEAAGPGITERHSSRGAAFGDVDNSGRIAVLVNNQNEPPSLLKQTGANGNHWVALKLTGTKSNRSAIGAKVKLTANGRTQMDEVRSGGSYLSQNDLRLHFGLGSAARIDEVQIDWPGGLHQVERALPIDRVVSITEATPLRQAARQMLELIDASNFADGLEAAALLLPAVPSLGEEFFNKSLAMARPADRYDATIRFHLDRGETEAAIQSARAAKDAGRIAIPGMQELLIWLATNHPPRAADLFRELLASLPAKLAQTPDLLFVLRNLQAVAATDPALAAQAAERILGSVEGSEFQPIERTPIRAVFATRPKPVKTATTRDTMLFAAGMYLSALDPKRFAWRADLLAPWRDALRTKDTSAIRLPWPPIDRPKRAAPVPQIAALKQTLDATFEAAFPLRAHRGKPVLVAFWATWCPPCKREMPFLDKLSRAGAVTLIGVSAEPTATVEAYMKANSLGFRNIADDGQQLHDAFEVSALPALLLFDREGRLVKRFSDELSAEDLRALTTRIGLFQVELGHLIAHAVPADAQHPGRLGLVPVSLLQSVYQ